MEKMGGREFLDFLRTDLAISDTDLQLALRYTVQAPNVEIDRGGQLDQIFEWLFGKDLSDISSLD
jgi:hypothetical protein